MKPKRLIVVRFRKDRGKWEVDRWNPPGSETARSRTVFDTEEEALTYAAEIAPTLGAAAPPARDQHMTLEQAFTRYLEATARKRSHAQDERMAEYLKAHFGPNTRLRDITANKIAQYKEQRLAAGSVRRKNEHGRPAPLSAASINRPLALLRSLLRRPTAPGRCCRRCRSSRWRRSPRVGSAGSSRTRRPGYSPRPRSPRTRTCSPSSPWRWRLGCAKRKSWLRAGSASTSAAGSFGWSAPSRVGAARCPCARSCTTSSPRDLSRARVGSGPSRFRGPPGSTPWPRPRSRTSPSTTAAITSPRGS